MKIKENKGITLIALVVTIIVLIILATISVNSLFGEGGLIHMAQMGKEEYQEGEKQEEVLTNRVSEYISSVLEGPKVELPEITEKTPAGVEVKIPEGKEWNVNTVKAISDGKGGVIPLPKDFQYVEGDIETGIVISDQVGNQNQENISRIAEPLPGNEFVWIPVENENILKRATFGDDGKENGTPDSEYVEPYSKGYEGEASQYNTMREQVLKYGGFYIGRYEAGDGTNGTTPRTKTTEAHEVVVKRGVTPYNYVSWGKSVSDMGTQENPCGAAYLAENMYTGKSDTVASTLVYGCQWDAMCRYIGDSQRTITSSAVGLTGSNSGDVSKNIYDLAGNCSEWTMEAGPYNLVEKRRVLRRRFFRIFKLCYQLS